MICPLEFRYGREIVREIFDEKNRLKLLLRVEVALAKAHADVGNISIEDYKKIENASLLVTLEEVRRIEKEINHEIMALVKALTKYAGSADKYVHLGATSNDIIDTATALQLSKVIEILEQDLCDLKNILLGLARKYKRVVMVGRTHGQFAVPTTFGLKIAVYATEIYRHLERLRECKKRILVGKMSGAVGTGAAFGKHALKIQELVMKELGLSFEDASTQIVARDRYAEFILLLANLTTTCEKFATEIRNLQRSEIHEVEEAFDTKKQVGSSTMAQKKNPILSENICGLARIVRSFVNPALENCVIWHERDLTNSSAERFIIPHVCILTDDILTKTIKLFSNLRVYPENMKKNLELSKGLIMAECVMMQLVAKGIGRQDAHEIIRECSMIAMEKDVHLRDVLYEKVKILTKEEIYNAMNFEKYIGMAVEIVDKIVANY